MLSKRSLLLLSAGTGLALATLSSAAAQDAPIIQPGAPGKSAKTLKADEAVQLAGSRYIQADVDFMQAMIPHHYQAVQMAELIEARTNNPAIVRIGSKIKLSQSDEIIFMQEWLKQIGKDAPDPAAHAAKGHSPGMMHADMKGMATPDQMKALSASSGTDFDRMFLKLMIAHHQGALDMVSELRQHQGAAYDPVLFSFLSDIRADQQNEIQRMASELTDLANDPRATLAAGFLDAGQAVEGMTLVGSLPKPPGFFDPANPSGLSIAVSRINPLKDAKDERRAAEIEKIVQLAEAAAEEASAEEGGAEGTKSSSPKKDAKPQDAAPEKSLRELVAEKLVESRKKENEHSFRTSYRNPIFSFANTDMAFSGDTLVVGNYHGFNIYDIGGKDMPQLVSSVVCPGGQGDVSIVGDLLIMSVEQTRGRVDCGLQGIAESVSDERFRGVRIFDIGDLTKPRQVGQVQTCRGSHTHSVVAEDDTSILIYNSGTSGVRDEKELANCVGAVPGDTRTALFSIDVIEVPKKDPASARIIDSPRIFADGANIAGLWSGGDHGDGTQNSSRTDQCHDITIYPSKNIAAGACSGNGIILDIADPRAPKRIDDVTDDGFAYWHSATFNNDGSKVLFTDEWGGGGMARCRNIDPPDWGADAIYDFTDGKLEARSTFKLPAEQSSQENCVAHNGSLVPIPGRDIFVQAWYQGGISIIDFTDSGKPFEIAYFDRGPINAEKSVLGGHWSVYWYNGRIYGTEIARGLDVLELVPNEHISANEIAAAKLASQGETFNPQQQYPVTWPDDPVVALALLDQLERRDGFKSRDGLRSELEDMRDSKDMGATAEATNAAIIGAEAAGLGDSPKEQMLAQMLARLWR